MGKPLIVMALKEEGQGLPESLGFEVVYCGVGKVNAAYHLTKRLMQRTEATADISMVLNLGSAGSHTFRRGTLAAADRFIQRDMDVSPLGFTLGATPFDAEETVLTLPRHFEDLPHGICASGDSFLSGPCPVPADIIDMEAYALAKICLRERIPFACVKYITDGADGQAATDWSENLRLAANAFSTLLNLTY